MTHNSLSKYHACSFIKNTLKVIAEGTRGRTRQGRIDSKQLTNYMYASYGGELSRET